MFIGRREELSELNNAYNQDAFQCALIYGKHHIGKTALIREFVRDKNCIWLNIPEMNEKMILRSVSNSIREQTGDYDLPDFGVWERVLETIVELCESERYVIVINEPAACPDRNGEFHSTFAGLRRQPSTQFECLSHFCEQRRCVC